MSVRNHLDWHFFISQGLDAIRKHFSQPGDDNDGQSWQRLRQSLRITEDVLRRVYRHGVDVRHGGLAPPLPNGERFDQHLSFFAKVIARFIDHLGGRAINDGLSALPM